MPVNPLSFFTCIYGFVEVLGGVIVILMLTWLSYYRGGFSWRSNPSKQFNWHPLLMIVGFLYLQGNAILVFRAFRYNRKKKLKLMHAFINLFAIGFIALGLQAAFDSHNFANPPIPNLYSLHSWLGITTVTLSVCQWIFGCATFLWPGATIKIREFYLPVHVYSGALNFTCVIMTCLLGLTEKALFGVKDYSKLPHEGILINTIGFFITLFGLLLLYLIFEPKLKREPIPEDTVLLTTNEPMPINNDPPIPQALQIKKGKNPSKE